METDKKTAISYFLKTSSESLTSTDALSNGIQSMFKFNKQVYFVLDEDEANLVFRSRVVSILHKHRTSDIIKYMDGKFKHGLISTLQSFGAEGGVAIKKLMGKTNYGNYCNNLASSLCNGRGTLISTYDGLEHKLGSYFIYRLS